jgi:hypothetical protein
MLQKEYNKRRTGSRDMYNAEGYKDMTAYLALRNIAREEREARAKQTCRKKRRSAHRPPADRLKAGLHENERFAWEELANAIIIRAAEDWREAKRKLQKHPGCAEAKAVVKETESFFLSRDYAVLTTYDGRKLLKRLREEFGE